MVWISNLQLKRGSGLPLVGRVRVYNESTERDGHYRSTIRSMVRTLNLGYHYNYKKRIQGKHLLILFQLRKIKAQEMRLPFLAALVTLWRNYHIWT